MLTNFLEQYQNHTFLKYIKYLGILLLIYISYHLHIWSNTQSTDNAYTESDISFISSEISGIVQNVLVTDNMKVKKGDIIAEINDEDLKNTFHKAESEVNAGSQSIKVVEQKIIIERINLDKNKEVLALAKQT